MFVTGAVLMHRLKILLDGMAKCRHCPHFLGEMRRECVHNCLQSLFTFWGDYVIYRFAAVGIKKIFLCFFTSVLIATIAAKMKYNAKPYKNSGIVNITDFKKQREYVLPKCLG